MTSASQTIAIRIDILIHTSVKLVTLMDFFNVPLSTDFNPHEREARDRGVNTDRRIRPILIHTSVKLVTHHVLRFNADKYYFNPHEREARDRTHRHAVPFRA